MRKGLVNLSSAHFPLDQSETRHCPRVLNQSSQEGAKEVGRRWVEQGKGLNFNSKNILFLLKARTSNQFISSKLIQLDKHFWSIQCLNCLY